MSEPGRRRAVRALHIPSRGGRERLLLTGSPESSEASNVRLLVVFHPARITHSDPSPEGLS